MTVVANWLGDRCQRVCIARMSAAIAKTVAGISHASDFGRAGRRRLTVGLVLLLRGLLNFSGTARLPALFCIKIKEMQANFVFYFAIAKIVQGW